MRCPMCGKKMVEATIDGAACFQCPRETCRWMEQPAPAAVKTEEPDK